MTIAALLARGPSEWDGSNCPDRTQVTGFPLVMMGVAITLAIHAVAHAGSPLIKEGHA
ncbi:MAG: hypothetical protein NVSMB65_15270 [Chloroflexota bacterium]